MNAVIDLLTVPELANKQFAYSGIDTLNSCLDKELFIHWSHPIEYKYNTRGFRDQEWPVNLANAVWCIGDSFTVGIGSPESHTWPKVLAQKNKCSTINISMDGASNAWIARQARLILNHIRPHYCVIQWSFLHRTENKSFKKMHHTALSADSEHNIPQWRELCAEFACYPNVVQSVIPDAAPGISRSEAEGWWWNLRQDNWPEILPNLPPKDITVPQQFDQHWQLQSILSDYNVILVQQKDRARDGFHYDIQTANWFVDKISHRLR